MTTYETVRNVCPTLNGNVLFWGVDITKTELKKEEGDKVKLLDLHPRNPWVLSVDRDEDIYVWDYSMDVKLFHKNITVLLNPSAEAESSPSESTGHFVGRKPVTCDRAMRFS